MAPAVRSARILVLASRYDLACDYVVAALRARGEAPARLNVEDLPELALSLDPAARTLRARSAALALDVDPTTLAAVYFRQPVFLRESALAGRPPLEQIARAQWAAFVRSLLVFDRARWVNPPAATYLAEHKAVQLAAAADLGFDVPRTAFTNAADDAPRLLAARPGGPTPRRLAVKGVDTVIARDAGRESFGYTTLVDEPTLRAHDLAAMPFTLQEGLEDKLDLRVTVVGGRCWCAEITTPTGRRVDGDWRLRKGEVRYGTHDLPDAVGRRCVALVRRLGLVFGAVDLALVGGRYFFLEVNPTGEWAWLQDAAGFPLAGAIADVLTGADAATGG